MKASHLWIAAVALIVAVPAGCAPASAQGQTAGALADAQSHRHAAFTVLFADGVRGMVDFTVRVEAIAPERRRPIATPQEAEQQLMAFLKELLRAELGRYTLAQARARQPSIAAGVLVSAKAPIRERFAYVLHDLSLGAIWKTE